MSEKKKKSGFTFECTKCGDCCAMMGPIPLLLEDIQLWVQENVMQNMFPYIQLLPGQDKVMRLYLTYPAERDERGLPKDPEIDWKMQCAFYNGEKNECQLFLKEENDYRPQFCHNYPLEYTGSKFQVLDVGCPGLKAESMPEELQKAMIKGAKEFYEKSVVLDQSLPMLTNIFQPFIIKQIVAMQEQMMGNMTPEQRKEMEEEMRKMEEEK